MGLSHKIEVQIFKFPCLESYSEELHLIPTKYLLEHYQISFFGESCYSFFLFRFWTAWHCCWPTPACEGARTPWRLWWISWWSWPPWSAVSSSGSTTVDTSVQLTWQWGKSQELPGDCGEPPGGVGLHGAQSAHQAQQQSTLRNSWPGSEVRARNSLQTVVNLLVELASMECSQLFRLKNIGHFGTAVLAVGYITACWKWRQIHESRTLGFPKKEKSEAILLSFLRTF